MTTHDAKSHHDSCWDIPERPLPALLDALKSGPFKTPDREALLSSLRHEKADRPVIFVGAGTCGLGAGADKTLEHIRDYCEFREMNAAVLEVGCLGLCSEEPIVDVQLPGKTRVSFGNVTGDKVGRLLEDVFSGIIPKEMLLGQHRGEGLEAWSNVPFLDEHRFLAMQKRWVLANSGIIDFKSIDEYVARGGYSALYKTLFTLTPQQVVDEVLASGLRGRGGGGFPTGKKWQMALTTPGDQKYMICNADEGDPGAFMDRAVCESDPHRLLEGMITGCYAIGASKAYIYIRAEYPLAITNLKHAMAQAQAYGLLGENILGSGFSLDIIIKMGAGAFVCGEETALMHSIEGKRGTPSPRPPYPVQSGLFGKPTVINNVETFANVPQIMQKGSGVFAALGTAGSKGTKVFAMSGMVRNTGLVEVPMGTKIRDVVFEVGGGVANYKKCKAVQIGGPSGGCIPEAHLDLPCDYEELKKFAAIMGSGGLVVLDEHTCMVDLAKYFMEFIQSESCGKCIPCREGTRRMLEILKSITRNRKGERGSDTLQRMKGVMQLQELGEAIKRSSLCGLGQTAPNPVLSTLKWFRDEYEAHVFERRCPAGTCLELVGAPCQAGCPVGTETWRYVAHIARGEYEEAYRTIRTPNPFPSACARICTHPCEDMCRCGTTGGEPIAIRNLKRFVVDRISPEVFKYTPKTKPDAPKVAVIGAGPSGLTAAHNLSLQGYKVTVFEKEAKAGGMMVCGIPVFRLPHEVVAKEINALLNENMEIKTSQALGRDFTIDSLKKDGYKAIYVAIGSHRSKKLNIPGEDANGVIPGIRFLKAYNLHGAEMARGKVGIIGGGDGAIDAARVAIRQRGVEEVTIFYRRTRDEMPALDEEIEAALLEGIKIQTLLSPIEAIHENGRLKSIRFQRNELLDRDETARFHPVPIPGDEIEVPLDTLVAAISEEPDYELLEGLKLRSGHLVVNPESWITSEEGIFGGGDVTTGPTTVISSVAAGRNAAVMIDRYLTGRQMRKLTSVTLPSVYVPPPEYEEEEETEFAGRMEPSRLAVAARAKNYNEVDLCPSEQQALCEARRCLRCDIEFTQPE